MSAASVHVNTHEQVAVWVIFPWSAHPHVSCWVYCNVGWLPYVPGDDLFCLFRLGSAHPCLCTVFVGHWLMWSGSGVYACLQALPVSFTNVHDTDGQARSQVVFVGICSDTVAQVRCWLGYASLGRLSDLQNSHCVSQYPLISFFV